MFGMRRSACEELHVRLRGKCVRQGEEKVQWRKGSKMNDELRSVPSNIFSLKRLHDFHTYKNILESHHE